MEASMFTILVATDNHAGFMEKDPVRGNDSFEAIEEIFQIAQKEEVDFLLLGGDLFHEQKPSRTCEHKIMEIFRKYTLGSNPVNFQVVSDQMKNFGKKVNYEDENVNIGLPVFSIHGNHDEPIGDKSLSSLDMLASSNYINYFGKVEDANDIAVSPVLLKKGDTHLALYGLGNIRDERLFQSFANEKVEFFRPNDRTKKDWFNIFVIHQNRRQRSEKNAIPTQFLPDWLDYVIWGHEHECLIEPTEDAGGRFVVSQPGSSVVTSLIEGEAKPKHVSLLRIFKDRYKCTKVPLRTPRPFEFKEIDLDTVDVDPHCEEEVERFLEEEVEKMIEKARASQDENYDAKIPLIRLKVEYTEGKNLNATRFGQRFVKRVANPQDILKFSKRKVRKRAPAGGDENVELPDEIIVTNDKPELDKFVSCYLDKKGNLRVLKEKELTDAVEKFIKHDDSKAIHDFVDAAVKATKERLLEGGEQMFDEDALRREIEKMGEMHMAEKRANMQDVDPATQRLLDQADKAPAGTSCNPLFYNSDDDIGVAPSSATGVGAKSTASRRGRGTASTATRGRGKSTAASATGRGRGRGTASTTGRQTQLNFGGGTAADTNDAVSVAQSRSRRSTTKRAKIQLNSDSDDENDDEDDGDDDYNEYFDGGKKGKGKAKGRAADDSDDSDEYEKPKSSRKRKAAAADSDEDSPPPSKKPATKSTTSRVSQRQSRPSAASLFRKR